MKLAFAFLVSVPLLAAVSTRSFEVPLHFESRSQGWYTGQAAGYQLDLHRGGLEVRRDRATTGLNVRFHNARGSSPTAEQALPMRVTRIRPGNPPVDRHTWQQVRYSALYPGIDVVFHAAITGGNAWEYDAFVAPHADPRRIAFDVDETAILQFDANGDLTARTAGGEEMLWKKPVAYQDVDGVRRIIRSEFRIRGHRIAFELGAYDDTRPLVIDPTLLFSTYMGGSLNELARGIGTDSSGNIYICGQSQSGDLPTKASSYQPNFKGSGDDDIGDAFLAKFTPTGAVSYLTYIGGTGDEMCTTLAVDATGAVYIAGGTNSRNFPTTSGVMQTSYGGDGGNFVFSAGDIFVAKFNPQGTLLFSTYAGGSRDDAALGIALDSVGNAYITGATLSANFPASGGFQSQFGGGGTEFVNQNGYVSWHSGDAFVLKLSPAGQRLAGTYLGGSADDGASTIALDSGGNVWIAGSACSTNFPLQGAFQTTIKGQSPGSLQPISNNCEAFFSKFSSNLAQLSYSTFLGGNRDDGANGIAVDGAGAVYLAGFTMSTDFPVTSGAFQKSFAGPSTLGGNRAATFGDGFVAKFDPAANRLVYATLLGGTDDDIPATVAVDGAGNVFVAGFTKSPDFPHSADALQSSLAGRGTNEGIGDGFIAKLNTDGSQLLYSSLVGGNSDDELTGMVLTANGTVFLTGGTQSTDFPTTAGLQRGNTHNGSRDAFLSAFSGLSSGPSVGISNVASYNGSAISPGEVVAVFVEGEGPASLVTAKLDPATGLVATKLEGTRVLFNDIPGVMVYTSSKQLAVIVPFGLAGVTSAQVVVEYNGVKLPPVLMPVAPAVPGLFSANQTGSGQGAIQNEDFTYNAASNPAARGSVVVLYGTGQGQTTPPGVDGRLANSVFPIPAGDLSITVGGIPVAASDILFKGPIPSIAEGFWQINIRLPVTLGPGTHAVRVTVAGRSSQDNLTLTVK
jgi:uncharacterized protein (TIGR03437 family)